MQIYLSMTMKAVLSAQLSSVINSFPRWFSRKSSLLAGFPLNAFFFAMMSVSFD